MELLFLIYVSIVFLSGGNFTMYILYTCLIPNPSRRSRRDLGAAALGTVARIVSRRCVCVGGWGESRRRRPEGAAASDLFHLGSI